MRNEVKLANPNYDSSKIEEFKNVWSSANSVRAR